MAGHEATVMCRGFKNTKHVAADINGDLMFSLTNRGLIIISKFREIWNDFGALAPKEPRVVPTRRPVQPFIDRIDVWPGLSDFRNTTLAHAYLDKRGKLSPPTALLHEGKAPSFHAEVILLLQLVVYTSAAVLQAFEDVHGPIDSTTRDGPKQPPGPGPGIELGSEIDFVLGLLVAAVDERCATELGRRLDGWVVDGFREAMRRPSRSTQSLE